MAKSPSPKPSSSAWGSAARRLLPDANLIFSAGRNPEGCAAALFRLAARGRLAEIAILVAESDPASAAWAHQMGLPW